MSAVDDPTEEPPREQPGEPEAEPDEADRTDEPENALLSYEWFPYASAWGWPTVGRWRGDAGDRDGDGDADVGVEGRSWGERLASLFLVVGVLLFLFPEPFTSALGLGLVVVGVLVWVLELV